MLRTTLPLRRYPNYFVDCRWGNDGSEKLNHLSEITQHKQEPGFKPWQWVLPKPPTRQLSLLNITLLLALVNLRQAAKNRWEWGWRQREARSFLCIVRMGHLVTSPYKLPSELREWKKALLHPQQQRGFTVTCRPRLSLLLGAAQDSPREALKPIPSSQPAMPGGRGTGDSGLCFPTKRRPSVMVAGKWLELGSWYMRGLCHTRHTSSTACQLPRGRG